MRACVEKSRTIVDVEPAGGLTVGEAIARPILVDCSHDNSGKDHRRQGSVLHEVLRQVRGGESRIAGFLLESHLKPRPASLEKRRSVLEYGARSTAGCIAWEKTERLLYEAASDP